MTRKALIVQGGWDGHEPDKVAAHFGRILVEEGFEVEIADTLNVFDDPEKLKPLDLIVPVWTMGEISKEQVNSVAEAVGGGTGLAGCHGGMCDAFRSSVLWQFMTGGNWVSHPGGDGVDYKVEIAEKSSPLTDGIRDFNINSEQYYLHVDPVVDVLATTRFPVVDWFHSPNGEVDMPVVWTKKWGYGRVYYNALGHHEDIFNIPEAEELMRRGLVWAAKGKDLALESGVSIEDFASDRQMF